MLVLLLSCGGAKCDPLFDVDNDGANECEDCDDQDPTRGAPSDEICDGLDNDCDSEVDEDAVGELVGGYADLDGDGLAGTRLEACALDPSWSPQHGGDCDDDDAMVTYCADRPATWTDEQAWALGAADERLGAWMLSDGSLALVGSDLDRQVAVVGPAGVLATLDASRTQVTVAHHEGVARAFWLDGSDLFTVDPSGVTELVGSGETAVWIQGLDADGDGTIDLLRGHADGTVEVTSSGTGSTVSGDFPDAEPRGRADVNGDGFDDWIYERDGELGVAQASSWPIWFPLPVDVDLTHVSEIVPIGDVDGDGVENLALAGYSEFVQTDGNRDVACSWHVLGHSLDTMGSFGSYVDEVLRTSDAPDERACASARVEVNAEDALLLAGSLATEVSDGDARVIVLDGAQPGPVFPFQGTRSSAVHPGSMQVGDATYAFLADSTSSTLYLAHEGTWTFVP